jgi:hypothetical protein
MTGLEQTPSGKMESYLLEAARREICIPMPDDEHTDMGSMAQQGLMGKSPNDRNIFPGCVEEQVRTSRLSGESIAGRLSL